MSPNLSHKRHQQIIQINFHCGNCGTTFKGGIAFGEGPIDYLMFVEFQTDDVSNLSDSLLVRHRHEPSMKSLGVDFALEFL